MFNVVTNKKLHILKGQLVSSLWLLKNVLYAGVGSPFSSRIAQPLENTFLASNWREKLLLFSET